MKNSDKFNYSQKFKNSTTTQKVLYMEIREQVRPENLIIIIIKLEGSFTLL